jgi:hypothetical protein
MKLEGRADVGVLALVAVAVLELVVILVVVLVLEDELPVAGLGRH